MSFLKKPSLIVTVLLAIIIIVCHKNIPKYKLSGYTQELTFDVTSYYLHLPMSFIYHDPGMKTSTLDSLFAKYQWSPTLYQIHHTENNTRVPNYTLGMTYYYFPFFFIAHAWAKSSDKYPADGFSYPYQFMISWGTIFIGLIGLFVLRKYIRLYFSEAVVSLVLIWLVLGTNYLSEALSNSLQPHYMQFMLYTVLLWYTDRWHKNPTKFSAFMIGLTVGWLTVARPSDILSILIPVFYGLSNRESLKNKIQLIRSHIPHLLMLTLGGLITLIPQIIYYKITTGSFLYYSYKNTEGFDFLSPHFKEVLFSFKKSLFIYTPLLIISVIGFYYLYKKYRQHFLFVTIFILCNFYLLSSWAAWWCGGSFGMRYFVQSYAVLALPTAACIDKLLSTRMWKYLIALPLLFLVFLNLFQTWQFENWIIPDDRMTYDYYKVIFLKTKVGSEKRALMEQQRNFGYTESFDNENEYTHHTLAFYDFENVNATTIDSNAVSKSFFFSPPNSCVLSEQNPYYPTYRTAYRNFVKEKLDHVWIRVSFYYYSEIDIKENPFSLVINIKHKDFNHKYRAFDIENYPFVANQWNYKQIDYMTPYPYSVNDIYEIYGWYRGHNKVYIDNLKIEIFEKKEQLKRFYGD
jgi:hypothetical protein